ncbi:MAG TPA: hypothetical protein QF624_07440 [Dehalococcoidia bacterium]|nr:hypothetical protein [Dehalococcoidia bacterium]
MYTLTLDNDDLRLVYLATVYHLGRPGSEIDAVTLKPHSLGLGSLREALEPQLANASADVDLSDYQLARLGQALHGIVNELKQFELAQGRSAVPGFSEAMEQLYPGIADQSGASLDLVQQAIMLRRRLDAAVRDAEVAVEAAQSQLAEREAEERQPWWKFWAR